MLVRDGLQGADKPPHVIWVCDVDSRTSVCKHRSFHPINCGIIIGTVFRPKTSFYFADVKCGFDGATAPAIELQGDAVTSEMDFDAFHHLFEAVRAGVDWPFSSVGLKTLALVAGIAFLLHHVWPSNAKSSASEMTGMPAFLAFCSLLDPEFGSADTR